MTNLTKVASIFAETEIDDAVVLMHIDTGNFHTLKTTGLAIWRMIDGSRDEAAICAELHMAYDVDAEICRAEVTRFVTQMRVAGFLERGV